MRVSGVLIILALSACSQRSDADEVSNTALASEEGSASAADAPYFIQSEAGRYKVEVEEKLDPSLLPQNADLKMVDGDLAQYAAKVCGFDEGEQPARCALFVQPDQTGLLTGYAALLQGARASIRTDFDTNDQKGGISCWISGDLQNADYEQPNAKLEVGKDFEARLPYAAWEKSPGDWLVSPDVDNSGDEWSMGMWYIKQQGNKLRISQERWSYCYKGNNIYIDEVFKRAVTLTKV